MRIKLDIISQKIHWKSTDLHSHSHNATEDILQRKRVFRQMKQHVQETGEINSSFEKGILNNPDSRRLFSGVQQVESSLKRARKKVGIKHPQNESEIDQCIKNTKFEMNYYGGLKFTHNDESEVPEKLVTSLTQMTQNLVCFTVENLHVVIFFFIVTKDFKIFARAKPHLLMELLKSHHELLVINQLKKLKVKTL